MPRPPKECVMLIGLPGSGKSTFYLAKYFRTHMRINLDMLSNRNRERRLFTACLADKQACVIDNTNLTIATRDSFIALAREHGFATRAYIIKASPAEAKERNRGRDVEARVPDVVIDNLSADYERPTYDEGFDNLYEVQSTIDAGDIVYDIVEI
jgi:predicted kinase